MAKVEIYSLNPSEEDTYGFIDVDLNDFKIDKRPTTTSYGAFSKRIYIPQNSFVKKVKDQLGLPWGPFMAWRFVSNKIAMTRIYKKKIEIYEKFIKQLQ